ncbi:hypothetical protein F5Y12DRAFT_709753 [Xylaria sp. FL1777]|nr:hypothetical protein F5Y12DRAFT_709753 [Xylaria sp. FL1777]
MANERRNANVFGRRNLGGIRRQGGNAAGPIPQANVLKDRTATKTVSIRDKNEGSYNLLTCLACAQHSGVDLIGITWIDAQGLLGRGGQAAVSQTRASAHAVLAFKRPDSTPIGSWLSRATTSQRDKLEDVYRAVASEILVLGDPEIRSHPNIVRLHAISWEIHETRSWFFRKITRVWPILVFEKASYGDLGMFMASDQGKALDIAARIELCRGVASAVAAAHKKGIVHGDIKPGNVLVFGDKEPVPKLADFGFAAFASNKHIRIVGTEIWRAPEIASRLTHTLKQAKISDAFSFGLLCLWVIFRQELLERGKDQSQPPNKNPGWLESASRWLGFGFANRLDPDINEISIHNNPTASRNKAKALAMELVESMSDTAWKNKLTQLFDSTLEVNAEKRAQCLDCGSKSEFEFITSLLEKPSSHVSRIPGTGRASDARAHSSSITTFPSASSFQVDKSLQSLCQADFRVREYIFHCLKEEYAIRPKKSRNVDQKTSCVNKLNIAVQLAFCKKIGFGTSQDDTQATRYLEEAREWQRQSGTGGPVEETYLESRIERSRAVQEHSSQWLRELYDTGIIQPVHQGLEFQSSLPEEKQRIIEARKKEIGDMEKALGATHRAVLNLKWSLTALLGEGADPIAAIDLLHEMVKALEAERKPSDRDLVLCKAYRAATLTRLPLPTDKILIKIFEQVDADLTRVGAQEHVIAFFICSSFSGYLELRGHHKKSEALMQRAKRGITRVFGPDHPNTAAILEQETNSWVRQGKFPRAIEVVKESIQQMEKLVGLDNMTIGAVRSKLAQLLIMMGEYNEADSVIKATNERFAKNFGQFHPATVVPMTTVAMFKGRFEEVCKIQEGVLHFIMRENEPWPPPQDKDPRHDLDRSPALRELLGEDGKNWEPPKTYPDPKVFSVHPGRMGTLATLAIAMHAYAEAESQNNIKKASQLRNRANFYLGDLMKHMNNSLGPEPWDGLSKTRGIEGSAMRRAMDEERTPLVELLSYLGDNGVRNRLHYKTAIAAATSYPKITALLEEHRDLCTTEADNTTPVFRRTDQLTDWLTGSWKGAYLYKEPVPRIDPKGHVTLDLKATRTGREHDHDVELIGRGTEESGEITVKGEAYKSGEVRLRLCLAGNDEDGGWEYIGFVNLERRAFGGFWGLPGIPRDRSIGTFFLYKDNEDVEIENQRDAVTGETPAKSRMRDGSRRRHSSRRRSHSKKRN